MTSVADTASPARRGRSLAAALDGGSAVPPARWRIALLALIALGFGLSALGTGLHSLSQWGPVSIGALALLFTLIVAVPAPLSRSALVALAGLLGVALWSLASATWAQSASQALVEGSRWLLYAATFAVLVLLLREARLAKLAIGFATAAILGTTGYVLVVMLLGGVSTLFEFNRLVHPLGYGNGQAAYFLLGLWPLMALAESTRRRLVAGLAVGGAFALAALLAASQTRAVIPALVISAIVLIALVPGRARRAWLLLTLLGGVAAISPALLAVLRDSTPEALRTAAVSILVAAALVGLAWTLGDLIVGRIAGRFRIPPARLARIGGSVAGIVAAVLAALAINSVADPVASVERRVGEFTQLRLDPAQTRFLSAGGNRYDYWRIALIEFREEPVKGVGAGNYQPGYHLHRRTLENVRQPHSLVLQVLAELGLVGMVPLLLFVAGVLLGLARTAKRARASRPERLIAVAAGGTFLVWLVHTSVDWLHLFPGLTGIALIGAAALVRPSEARRASRRRRRLPRAALPVASAIAIALAGVLVGRLTVAEYYRLDGREALAAGKPQAALAKANAAISLNGESVEARYLKAAALARLNAYAPSRATLLEALAREPRNFVTWALLGDLSLRAGDLVRARDAYARALALNPREPALLRALNDPRLATPEPPT